MILTGKTIPQLPKLTATTTTSLLPIHLLGTTYYSTVVDFIKSSPFGTFYQNLLPETNNTLSIGSSSNKLKSIFTSSITGNQVITTAITTTSINTNTVPTKGGTFAMLGDVTGNTVGSGSELFISASSANLKFRSLSSSTPSNISITTSDNLILFSGRTFYSTATNGSGGGQGIIQTNNVPTLVLKSLSSSTPDNLSITTNAFGNLILFSANTNTKPSFDYIIFNTATTSPTTVAGTVYFDNTEKALSYNTSINQGVTVNLGQQNYIRVYNNSGTQIARGKVLETFGTNTGLPSVTLAINTHTGFNIIGVSAEAIPNGQEGIAITYGIISGVSITGAAIGSYVYASDTIAGDFVNATRFLQFPLTARTNQVGYVLKTGTTDGKIFVNITNENSNLSLTDLERNVLEGNVISTGAFDFTGLTLASTTAINIAPVKAWLVDNTSNPVAPDATYLYYSGATNVQITNLTSATQTYIILTSASTISQQTTFPTPQQRRQNIYLGKVGHGTRTTILNVFNEVDFDVSPLSQLRDVFTPIKLINDGVLASANGGNLNINTSAGKLWGLGLNFTNDQLNPNSITVTATTPTTFQYRVQTGGTGGPYTATTVIDPAYYDLNGVRTAIGTPVKQATNQRIYMLQNGTFRIQYGQLPYADLTTAIAAVDTESFTTFSNFRDNAILIGVLSVRSDATLLNNTDQAKFTFSSKFGEVVGGTGGISTTTLQQAYNNSTTPEILISSPNNALTIKNGAGADTTNLFEGQNSGGTITSFIRADGTISGLTFLGDGSQLSRYYGSFYSTSAMTAANTTTAYIMSANTTGLSNLVILSGGSKFVMQSAGTYDIKYSAQLIKTSGSPSSSTVSIWLRKNGTDIQYTNAEVDIKKLTANNGKALATWSYIDSFTAGQYVEFVWSTTSTDVSISNIGAQASPTRPTTPSLYVTVRQV